MRFAKVVQHGLVKLTREQEVWNHSNGWSALNLRGVLDVCTNLFDEMQKHGLVRGRRNDALVDRFRVIRQNRRDALGINPLVECTQQPRLHVRVNTPALVQYAVAKQVGAVCAHETVIRRQHSAHGTLMLIVLLHHLACCRIVVKHDRVFGCKCLPHGPHFGGHGRFVDVCDVQCFPDVWHSLHWQPQCRARWQRKQHAFNEHAHCNNDEEQRWLHRM